jgi:ubiquinone/menaquinone biosynthesis C-methylase UbiE
MVRSRVPLLLKSMDPQPTVDAYDRIISKAPVTLLARRVLRLGIDEGKALDIACGPGHLLCSLARLAPNLELHGVDVSPNMLRRAQERFEKKRPGSRIELHLGSAYQLPFESNTFDLVINTLALHCFEEPQRFFDELVRVMKPSGKGLILAYDRDAPRWVRAMARLYSVYSDWRKIPLDGLELVLDSSYAVEEIEDCLRKFPGMEWQTKEYVSSLIIAVLSK